MPTTACTKSCSLPPYVLSSWGASTITHTTAHSRFVMIDMVSAKLRIIHLRCSPIRRALAIRNPVIGLAAELGVGAMSLYRHVPDKDELLRLMADAAFGAERLPEPGPDGWRAKLEYGARVQWRAFRRHPWLAPELLSSLTHPPVVASGMRHVDWALRALAGLGLDERTMLHTVISLNGYIGGMAVSRAMEVESERDTGISSAQRQRTHEALLIELLHSGQFPALAGAVSRIRELGGLDELFEFGLQRQLDGIESFLAVRRH